MTLKFSSNQNDCTILCRHNAQQYKGVAFCSQEDAVQKYSIFIPDVKI